MRMTFQEYTELHESEENINHAKRYEEKQKKLEAMPVEKHVEKLKKTGTSMTNHVSRGGNYGHTYARDLARRYDDHADKMKEHHPEAWKSYCKEHGYSTQHSGSDFYA